MSRCLLMLVVMVVVSGRCRAEVVTSPQSSGVYCDCHMAYNRAVSIGIHCDKDELAASSVTCRQGVTTDVPPGYLYLSRYGMVKLYRAHTTWYNARRLCEKDGGRLAVPRDSTTVNAILQLFRDDPVVKQAFIGIHDMDKEGVYVAIDGLPAPYLKWANDEPNNLNGNEHCVMLNSDGTTNDAWCDWEQPFLCELVLRNAVPQHYQWVEAASHFVRVSAEKLDYEQAAEVCRKDGGQLAVLDTWRRAEAVARLLALDDQDYLLGLDDRRVEGDFVTADGRHLSDMEFQLWKKDEPSGRYEDREEDCLAIRGHGVLNDVTCSFQRRFICEMSPF